jgi:ribonucleoside-diphosphate reductase beta chain
MGTKKDCKLVIDEFVVVVRKVKISNEVLLAHSMALERASAKYPLTKVSVQTRTINTGATSEILENLAKGPLPKRIVIGMVSSDAFNGGINKNPFNYSHNNIKELGVSVDGSYEPYQPLSLDYTNTENPRFLRAYYTLIGLNDFNSHDISFSEYKSSYNLFVFDLSQDGCINTDHFNEEKTGNLRIQFKFSSGLSSAISVILYFEYETHFEINKFRQVDYSNAI